MNAKDEKDLYGLLGVSYGASKEAIKAAFKKAAKKYHPDVNPDGKTAEKFKAISKAYEILTDVEKRRRYDAMMGFKARQQSQTRPQPPPEKRESGTKPNSSKEKQNFNSVFEGIFEGVFQNKKEPQGASRVKSDTSSTQRPKINGSDVVTEVTISEKESITGTQKTVNILHTEKCPNCNGAKFINGAKCPICKGKGEISLHKKISIKIPQNVKEGQKIRIPNEGNKGQNGGKNGDLYLLLKVDTSGIFKFEGTNAILELPITAYEAALGASIDIPTPSGRVTMKIPPGTSSGQKFKLTAQGLRDSQTNKKSDQIVIIKIETNKNLSDEEKNLYEKIRICSKQKIRENLFNGV